MGYPLAPSLPNKSPIIQTPPMQLKQSVKSFLLLKNHPTVFYSFPMFHQLVVSYLEAIVIENELHIFDL